jgi:uncharacterized phage protein gp47/JayE
MYEIPDFATLRATYLRDVRNLLPDAATDGDSDVYVRATAASSAVYGLYQYLLWIARQIMPDTADTDYLERHAALRGITRKAAPWPPARSLSPARSARPYRPAPPSNTWPRACCA